MEMALTPKEVA
jgi:hypothetical protein